MASALALTDAQLAPASVEPDAAARADPTAFVRALDSETDALELMVQGARCAACLAKIERGLLAQPGVLSARLNLSTGRLAITWRHGAAAPAALMRAVSDLGYGVSAFDPEANQVRVDAEGRRLLRCLAVAGFAMMNIMMFSVPIWSGEGEMGAGTRTLLHWISALIAVPAALYAGQPFFGSAWAALRKGRANMDVPISLGVLLALSLSLYETAIEGPHAYFDGACMLLFLLLIGRYLDHRLREQARSASRDLLALQSATATRLDAQGHAKAVAPRELEIGDTVLLAPGDRVPVDCIVLDGASDIDQSMLTGESTPAPAAKGAALHAGAINLTHALTVRATARAADSTLAALARLIEAGEQGRARYVRIADRAAQLYVPVVHSLAAATFLGWLLLPNLLHPTGDALITANGVHAALLIAISVLIITCPCALGLAVPAVQIVATGRLFKRGVLIKSGEALERLAEVDIVVFDKTGTLTLGRPRLVGAPDADALHAAASLARASRHPLSRALTEAGGPGAPARDVRETPGEGLSGLIDGVEARLGRRSFAAPDAPDSEDGGAELWFTRAGAAPVRFRFVDSLRADARETVEALRARGLRVLLLSGDRESAVAEAARAVGVDEWISGAKPEEKVARIAALKAQGARVLMLGDGLNDAAALAAAHISITPGTAVDVSQAASDIVLQGALLAPVVEALDCAHAARRRVIENLAFSALYNFVAVPIAVLGFVTPLIAAAAMSGSSLAVTLNALRSMRRRPWA